MSKRSGRNAKAPAFQWYAPDALTDGEFAEMTFEERGVLITLLSYSWMNSGIPVEPERIMRLLRADKASFGRFWPKVSKSFIQSGDRLVNARQEREREFQAENRARRKAASDAANKAKALKSDTDSVTDSEPIRSPVGGVTRNPSPDTRIPPPGDTPRAARARGTGDHPECIQFWESEWSRTRQGTRFAIQAKDGTAVSWMLKQERPDEVRRRMTAMLEDPDAWVAKNASPALLRSKWSSYAVRGSIPGTNGHKYTAETLPSSGLLEMIEDFKK